MQISKHVPPRHRLSVFNTLISTIFDWKVRRLGMRERVKTRNDNGVRIWIFSQKLPFSVGFFFSKTNLGSTIHYTYTSYNKYFRLCYGFRGVAAQ